MRRAQALRRPALRELPSSGSDPAGTTLLDLVRAVSEDTEDDREVVAIVLRLLRSGRVRLTGSFRGYRF
jgi:hypothetical protein